MSNLIKRYWLQGWFRGCAWFVAGVFAILVGVRQYVGWAGTRRWEGVQAMLAREGESLDFRKVAPEAAADDANFCAIPALKDLPLAPENDDDRSELGRKRMRLVNAGLPKSSTSPRPPRSRGADLGKPIDLKAWADWMRQAGQPADSGDPAREVLSELSRNDALVGELALGLSRPESQWTPSWRTRTFPENPFMIGLGHYSAVQSLTVMLGLRSAAAARAGDAAKAHQSLLIAVRLNQANMTDPFLIGTLVACGCSAVIDGAVWELCDAHSGTAEEFRALQQELSRMDYHTSFLRAERGELAGVVTAVGYFKRIRDGGIIELEAGVKPPKPDVFSFAVHVLPDGWFDGNIAAIAEWRFDYGIKPLRDAGFPELLAKQDELTALVDDERSHLDRRLGETLALIAMPAVRNVCYKVVYMQCVLNEAIAACALERYRIEHGDYPDTLEEANRAGEKRIPPDVISGKAMGYRRTGDGRYALWCVGFDGKDDGGKRALDAANPERTRFADPGYAGDWVWDFPGK